MSNEPQWLAAYVEKCMVEVWDDDADELSNFGDTIAYRSGTASCIVRVEEDQPLMVRVMAKAVLDVRLSARLMREINEVNTRSRVANVWWHDGDVVVECSLFAGAVDTSSLSVACFHVGEVANDIGVGLAAMFDGSTPYPPFANDSEEAA